jgi:hypothetical protein
MLKLARCGVVLTGQSELVTVQYFGNERPSRWRRYLLDSSCPVYADLKHRPHVRCTCVSEGSRIWYYALEVPMLRQVGLQYSPSYPNAIGAADALWSNSENVMREIPRY